MLKLANLLVSVMLLHLIRVLSVHLAAHVANRIYKIIEKLPWQRQDACLFCLLAHFEKNETFLVVFTEMFAEAKARTKDYPKAIDRLRLKSMASIDFL